MIRLRYGNTNTFLIPATRSYLLLDTDYAGTLPAFYRAIKTNAVQVKEIGWVLATHYHPDHMGLIPDLMKQGVKLLLIDTQKEFVHFSDYIFSRDRLPFDYRLCGEQGVPGRDRHQQRNHIHTEPQPGQRFIGSG